MEPALVVIGVSYRTAPLAIRERFWMDAPHRLCALTQLIRSDAIDEAIVLSTSNRTEFYVWTGNASEAANSVLRFLTRACDLKLSDWSNFYRLVDDAAIAHVFRVGSGLDTLVACDPEVGVHLSAAWDQARQAGATGPFLDALVAKALAVAMRVRREAWLAATVVPSCFATVEVCRRKLGSLQSRSALIFGSGESAESAARSLVDVGASVTIASRTREHSQMLAERVGGLTVSYADRWQLAGEVDILVAATSAPHPIVTRADLELVMQRRAGRPMVVVDLAVPRNVENSVRELPGITLFDLDDLTAATHDVSPRTEWLAESERVIREEVSGFRNKLLAQASLPLVSALRDRLEQTCHDELEKLGEDIGPFTEDQRLLLDTLSSHVAHRLAASLGRQLKELPGHTQQIALADVIEHLFQLDHDLSTPSCAEPRK